MPQVADDKNNGDEVLVAFLLHIRGRLRDQ